MDAYIKINKDKFENFINKASDYKNNLINKKFEIFEKLNEKTPLNSKYIILNSKLDDIVEEIDDAYDIINLFSQEVDYVYLDFYTYNLLTNEIWKVDAFDT